MKTITIDGKRYRLTPQESGRLTRLDGPGIGKWGHVCLAASVPTDRDELREWVRLQVADARERHAAAVESLRRNGAIPNRRAV